MAESRAALVESRSALNQALLTSNWEHYELGTIFSLLGLDAPPLQIASKTIHCAEFGTQNKSNMQQMLIWM